MTTSTELVARVLETVRRHAMLAGGETVLVGLSGGRDSVALLHVLLALREPLGLALHVLHVHHGLRPEADTEAAFVEALARRCGLPITVERIAMGDARGQSLEAVARGRRYAAFAKWAGILGASRVALGHTADDQAETVLMRLLAGAGPRGLAGIPPVRGPYIRPLIELRRPEIEAGVAAAGLGWVDDPSNRDPKFLRNRIRHDLLPFLAEAYNPRIVEALCRAGALARALVADLERVAVRELERLGAIDAGDLVLSRAALDRLPAEIAAEVLRQGALRLGAGEPLRAWQYRALRRALAPTFEGPIGLGSVVLEASGDRLRVCRAPVEPLLERALPVPGSVVLSEVGLRIDAREFDRPASYAPPRDAWTVAFDRAGLGGPLSVRSRSRGDRFRPFGGPGRRRLKAFLIDRKIPRWRRDRLPLLVASGEIAWVVGVRRGALAPITPRTGRILEVQAIALGGSPGAR